MPALIPGAGSRSHPRPARMRPPLPPPVHVARPERIAELRHRIASTPLTLVIAPAGYGKTTLVADVVRGFVPTAWVRLVGTDDTVEGLATAWCAAFRGITPDPPFPIDGVRSPVDGALAIAARVATSLDAPHLLVVDNAHHLRSDAGRALVHGWAAGRDPRQHLVLIGRGEPAIDLPTLRDQVGVDVLTVDDLAFSVRDALRLLRALGVDRPHPELVRAHQATDGWVAGLLHLAAILRDAVPPPSRPASEPAADDPSATWGRAASLSRREREVLALLATGARNQEIADALFVSVHTVKRHVVNVLLKLDAETRGEAVALARRMGLI